MQGIDAHTNDIFTRETAVGDHEHVQRDSRRLDMDMASSHKILPANTRHPLHDVHQRHAPPRSQTDATGEGMHVLRVVDNVGRVLNVVSDGERHAHSSQRAVVRRRRLPWSCREVTQLPRPSPCPTQRLDWGNVVYNLKAHPYWPSTCVFRYCGGRM